MNDFLALATTCLTACVQQPPKQRRVKAGTYAGPLWSIDVPVDRLTIQRILRYATDGGRFVHNAHWATLVGLRASDDFLTATISSEIMGRQVQGSLGVALSKDEAHLLSGEWHRVYSGKWLTGEVKTYPMQLLPTVQSTSFGAMVKFKAGVRRRRSLVGRWILGEWQSCEVQGFRITPTYGELLTDSMGIDFVSPRFQWKVNP